MGATIQLVMNNDKPAYQIAQDLDINDKTLYRWIREYKKVHNIHTDDRRTTQKASPKEKLEIVKQEREI